MCSCPARPRSCTPTSTRSTRRSSSGTIRALRGRPVIVGGGVVLAASYEAKALRRPHRDGRRPGPPAVPAARSWSRRGCRPTREASKAVFEVFERHHAAGRGAVDRRGVPRRRRAAADLRHADRDRRPAAARGARAGRPADHRRGGPDQVPGQGGERRWPSPTGCWWCRPTASWRSSTRCRSSGCGASARSPPRKLRDRGITTVGEVARLGEAALVSMLGRGVRPPPARARPQPRPAAGAGRRAGAARSGRSARSGRVAAIAGGARRRRSSGSSTG